jgi:HlyD family secretion protein
VRVVEMRRFLHSRLFLVLLLTLVVGGAVAGWRARGPAVKVVPAITRDLEQHLVASGRVWVPERVTIAARAAGLVVTVGAVAGQRVAAGELLVQLDDAEARNTVLQAETTVAEAAARVAQLRRVGSVVATQALKQAETQLEDAQAEFESTAKLMVTRAVPADALDEARRAVDLAQAARNAALAQQVAAAPAGADSRVVLTAQLQAEAQLAGARLRLEQRRLAAPGPGVVLTRAVERGDTVSPGQALLTLAMDAAPQLTFQPDERNLALLALGQKGVASADAWPETRFDVELSYIAPAVDPQRGSIEVRLIVAHPPPFLRPDMTVSVDLTVARKAQVLTLPAEAVRDARTAAPYVLVAVDGRVHKRPVTLGIRGEGALEIASGLTEKDAVIVPRGEVLVPGQRVRPESD